MKEKTESQNLFHSLPWELTKRILLEQPEDQKNIALSCGLFNQLTLHERLAYAVTAGHQDSVEAILKKHPELLVERLSFRDKSGRLFRDTTVWEYVLWALDVRYMAPMMLQCLPHSEQGDALRTELDEQFDKVEKNGVTYELAGQSYTESHYDFAIIAALTDYVGNFANRDPAARGRAWCTIVGGSQWLVPAHVVQHYCDPDESFDPIPKFTKVKLTRSLKFYNWTTNKYESWYASRSCSSGLGLNFAIARSGSARSCGGGRRAGWWQEASAIDLAAMTTLCDVRTKDLDLLKQQLQIPLQKPVADPDSELMKIV